MMQALRQPRRASGSAANAARETLTLVALGALSMLGACTFDFSNPPARISTVCLSGAAGLACDDGNACTENDACDGAGACRGTVKVCITPPGNECVDGDATYRVYGTSGLCRVADGSCNYPVDDYACPDCTNACLLPCQTLECEPRANGCLIGSCNPGPPAQCNYASAANNTPCNLDGEEGRCNGGTCFTTCDGGCDDQDPCTDDTCVDGLCLHPFNTGDCGVCGICDGAGACTFDDSQDDDCGNDVTCGACQALGQCGLADVGTWCGTCMECDGGGQCDIPVVAGLQGNDCAESDTSCSVADQCDGDGACIRGHFDAATPCETCTTCDGNGACNVLTAEGEQGPNCEGVLGPCSIADECDGLGGCIEGNAPAGLDCGICGICDDNGVCAFDETQDADCGVDLLCASCQAVGVCNLGTTSTVCDTCGRCNGTGGCAYNAAADVDCGNPCQECTGLGTCGTVATNQQGLCPTCSRCNSSGACAWRPNDSQGPGCNSTCRECQSGACVGKEWECPTPSPCGGLCTEVDCEACCSTDCL